MIVVAIIGILATIAYPSYARYAMRAKRADAKQVLLQAAQWMERSYTVNYKYPTALPADLNQSPMQGSALYTIGLTASTDTSFTLSAVPMGAQAADECGTLTIDNLGNKTTTAGASLVQTCWYN